jgi:hypothetical protein
MLNVSVKHVILWLLITWLIIGVHATEISVQAFNRNALEDRYIDFHSVTNIIIQPRVFPQVFDLIQEWTFDG